MKSNLTALPRNSLSRTNGNTLSALNTLVVANASNVHLASLNTKSALGTSVLVEFNTDKRETAEETVKRAQRAEETAEKTENKDTADHNQYEKKELPSKKRAEHSEEIGVSNIEK